MTSTVGWRTPCFELLRDALGRLADVELERRVVDTAFDHFVVDDIVVGEFESIGDRGPASAGPIEVTTSFEPGEAGRRHVLDRLVALGVLGVADRETDRETDGESDRETDRAGGGDLRVSFRRDPRLVIGVRLRVAETSVEWSANDYLERFRSIVEIGLFEGEDG